MDFVMTKIKSIIKFSQLKYHYFDLELSLNETYSDASTLIQINYLSKLVL